LLCGAFILHKVLLHELADHDRIPEPGTAYGFWPRD
jgi:hypothetical protein